MKSIFLRRVAFLLTLLVTGITHAQTWVGGGTDWNDPNNWNPTLPANGSTIYIDGLLATVDANSDFRPNEIHIINGGELEIKAELDIGSEGYTYIDGSGSKLNVTTGGLFTSEFITSTNNGEIEISGGELDVADQLSMTDGIFNMFGGLLDYNGSTGEELLFTDSDVDISDGLIEFNRGMIVSGGSFQLREDATMTATNTARNLEFHSTTASLAGTVNNADGDLSLFGTSVVDLESTLSMDLDDLVMNDDGQSSTLNVHGTLVAFDDVKFDEDPPDDVAGDNDRIVVKDGGSLTVSDSFRDAGDVESGSGIHAESGATVSIGDIPGMTNAQAYGTIITSDPGATVTISGGAPLPIELILFEAEVTETSIQLVWSTAVEINNDYFDILKSTDGENFVAIARVQGAGNTNDIVPYSYLDRNVRPGIYYYQLKQVDFNGEFEYHEIIDVAVELEIVNSLSIFPNPVSSNAFTIFSQVDISQPRLSIYSLSGRLVEERSLVSSNKWTFNKSDLNLSNGTYILKINDELTGSTIDSIKISIVE